MKQDNTDRMFDKRVVRRNISTGRIQSDDYDRFLNALPDVVENIKPSDEGGDNDGYEENPPEAAQEGAEAAQPTDQPPAQPADQPTAQPADQPTGDPAAGFGSPAPGTEPPTGA